MKYNYGKDNLLIGTNKGTTEVVWMMF